MSLPPFDPSPAFRRTQPPDVDWKWGEGMRSSTELGVQWKEDEKKGWKTMNLDEMDKPLMYKMLISAVVPRPIAFVSTLSESGVSNLAPFSYFSLVSHIPPLVSVSFTLPSKGLKDTRENIKATEEFTVNIISEPFIEAANATCVEAPPEIDEWVATGLTPMPSEFVKPPCVRESAISFECKLFRYLDISLSESGPSISSPVMTTFVLGRIHRAHIRNAVLSDDGIQVDTGALRAIARLGGLGYARVGEGFELARPSWRVEGGAIREVLERKEKM